MQNNSTCDVEINKSQVQNNADYNVKSDESRYIVNRRKNLKTDSVEITRDKLENILLKFGKSNYSLSSCIAPFSFTLSIALTIFTADFHTTFGIDKNLLKAFYIICLLISIGITIKVFIGFIKSKRNNNGKSPIEYLIDQIMNDSERVDNN